MYIDITEKWSTETAERIVQFCTRAAGYIHITLSGFKSFKGRVAEPVGQERQLTDYYLRS